MTTDQFVKALQEIARQAGRYDVEVKLATLDRIHADLDLPSAYNSFSKGKVLIAEMHTIHLINAVRYQRRIGAAPNDPILVALLVELGARVVDGEPMS